MAGYLYVGTLASEGNPREQWCREESRASSQERPSLLCLEQEYHCPNYTAILFLETFIFVLPKKNEKLKTTCKKTNLNLQICP